MVDDERSNGSLALTSVRADVKIKERFPTDHTCLFDMFT